MRKQHGDGWGPLDRLTILGPVCKDGLVIAVAALCFLVGGLDACQALTGRRVSKRPSRRSDEKMRRQSAIAAVVLGALGLIGLVVG